MVLEVAGQGRLAPFPWACEVNIMAVREHDGKAAHLVPIRKQGREGARIPTSQWPAPFQRLLKSPPLSVAPPAEDPAFKHVILWGTVQIQTEAPSMVAAKLRDLGRLALSQFAHLQGDSQSAYLGGAPAVGCLRAPGFHTVPHGWAWGTRCPRKWRPPREEAGGGTAMLWAEPPSSLTAAAFGTAGPQDSCPHLLTDSMSFLPGVAAVQSLPRPPDVPALQTRSAGSAQVVPQGCCQPFTTRYAFLESLPATAMLHSKVPSGVPSHREP